VPDFPGNTADPAIIRTVTDDLDGWNLRRSVWVVDRGVRVRGEPALLDNGQRRPRSPDVPAGQRVPRCRSAATAFRTGAAPSACVALSCRLAWTGSVASAGDADYAGHAVGVAE